eukprot:TRINITY_DN45736_c0_g1_i2.p1 TRINITY_DN45736_c0_g1~~TRINITY_DN45736_c0_g1_i2.p1  ORF type:complete len:203 (+),score=27.47 TRINITY_DN45736_c0_g1_i2:88-696(+)
MAVRATLFSCAVLLTQQAVQAHVYCCHDSWKLTAEECPHPECPPHTVCGWEAAQLGPPQCLSKMLGDDGDHNKFLHIKHPSKLAANILSKGREVRSIGDDVVSSDRVHDRQPVAFQEFVATEDSEDYYGESKDLDDGDSWRRADHRHQSQHVASREFDDAEDSEDYYGEFEDLEEDRTDEFDEYDDDEDDYSDSGRRRLIQV